VLNLVAEVKREVSWTRPRPELGCRTKGGKITMVSENDRAKCTRSQTRNAGTLRSSCGLHDSYTKTYAGIMRPVGHACASDCVLCLRKIQNLAQTGLTRSAQRLESPISNRKSTTFAAVIMKFLYMLKR
jgi:hypothetical protein